MAEILAFPFEVLAYVDKVSGKNIDSAKAFIRHCHKRCADLYIQPNHEAVRTMQLLLMEESEAIQKVEEQEAKLAKPQAPDLNEGYCNYRCFVGCNGFSKYHRAVDETKRILRASRSQDKMGAITYD